MQDAYQHNLELLVSFKPSTPNHDIWFCNGTNLHASIVKLCSKLCYSICKNCIQPDLQKLQLQSQRLAARMHQRISPGLGTVKTLAVMHAFSMLCCKYANNLGMCLVLNLAVLYSMIMTRQQNSIRHFWSWTGILVTYIYSPWGQQGANRLSMS